MKNQSDGHLVLVALAPYGPAITYELPARGAIVVGRADEADIQLEHESVSRHHCTLHIHGEHVTIEDVGSRNGTRVAGKRIARGQRVSLSVGTLLELGDLPLGLQPRHDARTETELHSGRETMPSLYEDINPKLPARGPAMERIYSVVKRIAPDDVSVLILGETGSGKEVMAETIHKLSRRTRGPFLRLHCAALSETLFESELFGHERGAFTGANSSKAGLLETANGGSVFIDEVGELPHTMQVKLLRVLEDRSVRRVGGRTTLPIDVRYIAATNRDLETEVALGRFRQDLYFRLSGFTIRIPPLRERLDEIEPLVRSFVREACDQRAWPLPHIDAEVFEMLRSYTWPGNIRELKSIVVRALLVCSGGRLRLDHLPIEEMRRRNAMMREPVPTPSPDSSPVTDAYGSNPAVGSSPAIPLSSPAIPIPSLPIGAPAFPGSDASPQPNHALAAPPGLSAAALQERARIMDALERCAGNQTKAAKILGISRRTLITRLEDYEIPRPRKRPSL